MNQLLFKQGATFSLTGTVALPGSPNWSAACQIRDAGGGLVADTTVVLTPLATPTATETHSMVISSAADTSAWQGPLFFDVLYTSGDNAAKVPTDTVEIIVQRRQTVG